MIYIFIFQFAFSAKNILHNSVSPELQKSGQGEWCIQTLLCLISPALYQTDTPVLPTADNASEVTVTGVQTLTVKKGVQFAADGCFLQMIRRV